MSYGAQWAPSALSIKHTSQIWDVFQEDRRALAWIDLHTLTHTHAGINGKPAYNKIPSVSLSPSLVLSYFFLLHILNMLYDIELEIEVMALRAQIHRWSQTQAATSTFLRHCCDMSE